MTGRAVEETADHRSADIGGLLRPLAPLVLSALLRRFADFDSCEDAVQEALLAATQQWPVGGVPDNPKGWLITVASRRRIELWRSDSARRRREETAALAPPPGQRVSDSDDTLTLLLLCCHPSLTMSSQVALTLRAVGGLSTVEIARAFLVPEATAAQRISRAKLRIRASGARFEASADVALGRVTAVLQVLYLIFNEGYTATSGPSLRRADPTGEAIRLTRQLHERLPDDGEVAGLLALMLLTDARRAARTDDDGLLVPLAEQRRDRWDATAIAEGAALVTTALTSAPIGPFQLQAAIAAVHDEAVHADDTDWAEILALYDLLQALAPGPMVTLNRIVALGMVQGPAAALTQLETAEDDSALSGHHRVDAVRAHFLEQLGDHDAARRHYRRAAQRILSLPERQYLEARAAALP